MEVVIAMAIIAVAIVSSLLIMGKLTGASAKEGRAIVVMTASAVVQYAIDEVRDIPFPPITTIEKLEYDGGDFEPYPINPDYKFSRSLDTYDNTIITSAYYDETTGKDDFSSHPDYNLLKVAVTVYKNDSPVMTTYTYKVRNGVF